MLVPIREIGLTRDDAHFSLADDKCFGCQSNSDEVFVMSYWINLKLEVKEMKEFILAFVNDEEGLTMVEYAIAGALVAAGAVLVFTTLGQNVSSRINDLATDVGT